VEHCGDEISAYTAQSNFCRWKMFGALPRTRHSGETLWYAVGHNLIRPTTYKNACSQWVIGKLQLCNKCLAINLILLIGDSAKSF
jgi:hypothetical protein